MKDLSRELSPETLAGLSRLVKRQYEQIEAHIGPEPDELRRAIMHLAMVEFMQNFVNTFLDFGQSERELLMRFMNETHEAVEAAVKEGKEANGPQ